MSLVIRYAISLFAAFQLTTCCTFAQAQTPPVSGAPGPTPAMQGDRAKAPRLLRAVSGPSGKTVGERFVLNEERNRFVIPQDKSMVVYMEWEGAPGEQKITGVWKRPDGSTGFLSSDIEMVTEVPQFSAFWTFYLNPTMEPGNWQFEAMVNGTPAGTYSFEVVSPVATEAVVETKTTAKAPSMESLYEMRKSLVWVHRLDELGQRLGTMSGFVVSEGVVATSYQAIDMADGVEIEFADGRKEQAREVISLDGAADWALLKVNTDILDALPVAAAATVELGERLVAFNVEVERTRVIGGVDYTGRSGSPGAERFVFNPGLAQEAMGGPIFDAKGNAIGLLSGCVAPGARLGAGHQAMGSVAARLCSRNTAVPLTGLMENLGNAPVAFASLRSAGTLAPPLRPVRGFELGETRKASVAKPGKQGGRGLLVDDTDQFTRGDRFVAVHTWWKQPADVKTQPPLTVTAAVFDAENRPRVKVEPGTLRLNRKVATEHVFTVPVEALGVGLFRIDVYADGACAWRTILEVRE